MRVMTKPLLRHLRANMTDAERKLWRELRGRRFVGHKFRRQVPLGPFVIDFLSYQARLAIELDGGQHALQQDRDAERTAWIEAQGYRVLRFWNDEILTNGEGVLQVIDVALRADPSP